MDDMGSALGELEAEQRELDEILNGLSAEQWSTPTPSQGWDIRDQVSHLADTNEIAVDTMTDGPRSLNVEVGRFDTPEAFTQSGCERGRAMEPKAVLEWWRESGGLMNETFGQLDPKQRVPWGLGMTARTLVTARQMEHWAHGLDIRDALGIEVKANQRLRSVAWLITRALPYAFTVSQTPLPADRSLRIELDAMIDGQEQHWSFGPQDATDLIRGDALEFCRLGVQRCSRSETRLEFEGSFADMALDRLRAYL